MKKRCYQFSVIIPTYNRPQQIISCLFSLIKQDYPLDLFEVIVVDDGSFMPLDDRIKKFNWSFNLRLIRIQNGGPATARNRGVEIARGKFLAFTDDDCLPDPKWLKTMESQFEKRPENLLGGKSKNLLTQNIFSAASQSVVEIVYAYYNDIHEEARFITTNNMAVDAQLFRKGGGFDSNFKTASEDREFCDRWLNIGGKITYVPEAVVYHAHPMGFSGFCKQHLSYGRGAFQYHSVRKKRGSGSIREDISFYTRLFLLAGRKISTMGYKDGLRIIPLLLVWQFLNTAGFVIEMTVTVGSFFLKKTAEIWDFR